MSTYKSKPTVVEKPAAELFDRFSDMTRLQNALDSLTDEQRAQIGQVEFTADSIKIVTPQVGEIAFSVIERQAPSKIVFRTTSSPVPLTMKVDLKPLSETSTEVETVIDVDIPMMLRPMVGPYMQKAADKFGELIGGLSR
ncbi:MAG: hypothetical protein K2G30_00630 [Muribaculaceae bacterium]|nr:hypothetical protein [Muribaculaceae bacterium]MDE7142030.1 hypothetical protein [Muribaculaceae bacterium]